MADLAQRDWLRDSNGALSLTEEGQAAMAGLRESVRAIRANVAAGITEEQYATTLETLARMCGTLREFE